MFAIGFRGFLGQHLLKHLEKDKTVSEIRGLDKLPCEGGSKLEDQSVEGSTRLKFFQRDLIDIESCREVLRNVDVVIHAAALVTYEFPPPKESLRENNVVATENLIRLCLEEGVNRLIYCSTTEVSLQSYVRGGIVAVVIYSSESKVGTPSNYDRLIFGEYAASKLRAEKLVLNANGKALSNGSFMANLCGKIFLTVKNVCSKLNFMTLQLMKLRSEKFTSAMKFYG